MCYEDLCFPRAGSERVEEGQSHYRAIEGGAYIRAIEGAADVRAPDRRARASGR